MTFAISRTISFRKLQASIGSSTYRLNTIFVGLDCVAKGMGDGGNIAVTWTKPSAKNASSVAQQSRSFACSAALALSFDVIDAFLRAFANEKWLRFSVTTIEIATKSVTRPGGIEYSVADRFKALLEDLEIDDALAIATAELFSKWRNSVVHHADRNNRLTPEAKGKLIDAKTHFRQKYSHLDIELAIRNFESKSVPVAKEVTTLIAIMMNTCRLMDEAAVRRAAPDSESLAKVTEELLRARLGYGTDGSEHWKHLAASWRGDEKEKLTLLRKVLPSIGLTPTTKAISPPLPDSFCANLATLSLDQLAERFDIHRKH